MRCTICDWLPIYAKGRCEPCYRYLRRVGHDRPILLAIAQGQRPRRRRRKAADITEALADALLREALIMAELLDITPGEALERLRDHYTGEAEPVYG